MELHKEMRLPPKKRLGSEYFYARFDEEWTVVEKYDRSIIFHRTGETDSWRAQTKPCVHQDPGERSSDPTRH